MQKLIGSLVMLLACAWAFGAPAIVQTAVNQTAVQATTLAATFGSAVTAGNLVIVQVTTGNDTDAPVTNVTDTASNTYTILDPIETGPIPSGGNLWYAWNVTGAFTVVTAHYDPSIGGARSTLIIREYSGIQKTSNPLDVHSSVAVTGSTTPTSGSVTTTAAGDLAIGWLVTVSAATISAGSGYANLQTEADGGIVLNGAIEDKTLGAAGAYAASFGMSLSSDEGVGIATFKAAPASGLTQPLKTLAGAGHLLYGDVLPGRPINGRARLQGGMPGRLRDGRLESLLKKAVELPLPMLLVFGPMAPEKKRRNADDEGDSFKDR